MPASRLLRLLAVGATLAISLAALAQAGGGEVAGMVRLASGGPPAPGTLITLQSSAGEILEQVAPEGSGAFHFRPLPLGLYYVTAKAPGFRIVTERAEIQSSGHISLQLILVPEERAPVLAPAGAIDVHELGVPAAAQKEFAKGRKLLEANDSEKSLIHFRKAIEEYSAYARAQLFLGVALMNLRQWKEAEAAFEGALRIDEKLAAAHLALGACENEQGKFAAAEGPLLRGLALAPETADGHYQLGRTYWALGRWEEAEPHAQKALSLRPDFAPVHLLLGNLLLHRREASAALEQYKEYLRLDPAGAYAGATRGVIARLEQQLAASR